MPLTLRMVARLAARRATLATLACLALLPAAPAAARVAAFDGGDPGAASNAALSAFERGLPSAVGGTHSGRLRGQIVAPELTSSGDHLSVLGALGAPTIAKDPGRGFVLDTGRGPVQIAPAWVDSAAPAPATVDDGAALFPSMATEVDALLRPTAAGVTTVLQLRSGLAAGTFSWSVAAPAAHTLRQLGDGSVAIVAGAGGSTTAAAPPAAARDIDEQALDEPSEQYEEARAADSAAADELPGADVLAIVAPPRAHDRRGRAVPTRLAVKGDTIELTVEHHRGTVDHSVFVELTATAPDVLTRPWRELAGTGEVQPGPDGMLKVRLDNGEVLLSHGPDRVGLDRSEGEDPLGDARPSPPPPEEEEENDDGAPWAAGTGPPFLCAYVGGPLRRIKVLYAGPDGADGLTPETEARIRRVMIGSNNKLYDEAVESGGRSNPARLRFDCGKTDEINVIPYELNNGSFEQTVIKAKQAGHTDPQIKYVIFSEHDNETACGEANQYPDDRLAKDNKANRGAFNETVDGEFAAEGTYAILYGRFCWQVDIAMHENAHTMGAVEDTAPHATGRGHCDDGYDVMCYDDRDSPEQPNTYSQDVCELGPRGFRFDCNYDTYFDTKPEDGSWLDTHWNLGHKYNLALGFETPRPYHEPYVVAGADDTAGVRNLLGGTDGGARDLSPIFEDCCLSADQPALSPDAEQIVYTDFREDVGCIELWYAKRDGSERRRLVDCTDIGNASITSPAFAGSNVKLLMDCLGNASAICNMEIDESNPNLLIDWEGHQMNPDETGSRRLIAFESTHTPGGSPVDAGFSQIFITKRDGENPVQFTQRPRFDNAAGPKFSQDGNRIAFMGWEPEAIVPQIYVARTDGAGLRQITFGSRSARNPTWTPDGHVVYTLEDKYGLPQAIKESLTTGATTTLAPTLHMTSEIAFRQAAYWQADYSTPVPQPIP